MSSEAAQPQNHSQQKAEQMPKGVRLALELKNRGGLGSLCVQTQIRARSLLGRSCAGSWPAGGACSGRASGTVETREGLLKPARSRGSQGRAPFGIPGASLCVRHLTHVFSLNRDSSPLEPNEGAAVPWFYREETEARGGGIMSKEGHVIGQWLRQNSNLDSPK